MIYTRKKGSVLVFSLIVLSIVLSTALSITAVNVSNRKSAASTAQSVQSFQVADTAVEKVMKAVYNKNYINPYAFFTGLGGVCTVDSGAALLTLSDVAVVGAKVRVSFYNTLGEAAFTACPTSSTTPTNWRDTLARVKVEGSVNGAVRVIEFGVAPLSSMAWGENGSGQLGDGTTGTNRLFPVSTVGGSKWKSVSAGNSSGAAHVLAVKANGTLWAWGLNDHGQLGDGGVTPRTSPIQIGTVNTWESVSAGLSHSLAIQTDHSLWSWGDSHNYRLGSGASSDQYSPVKINTCTSSCPAGWAAVSAGSNFSIALGTDNTLWAWGSGTHYRLGNNLTSEVQIPVQIGRGNNCSPSPCPAGWKYISAGDNHVFAISTDDLLYAWGDGEFGELGTGGTCSPSCADAPLPTRVLAPSTWKSVSAGNNHSLGIRKDINGTLWAWGRNQAAQAGNGTTDTADHPVPAQIGSSTEWNFVSAGLAHSFALKINGANTELWAWGNNNQGQVGDNNASNPRLSPSQILGNWQTVEGGDNFSIGVRK